MLESNTNGASGQVAEGAVGERVVMGSVNDAAAAALGLVGHERVTVSLGRRGSASAAGRPAR